MSGLECLLAYLLAGFFFSWLGAIYECQRDIVREFNAAILWPASAIAGIIRGWKRGRK